MTEITDVLREVSGNSTQLTAWAIAIAAGSLAIMVSTSHHRPKKIRWRLIYLLFIPGWTFIGTSIYKSNMLSSKYLASLMVKKERIPEIANNINDLYASQRQFLLFAIICFTTWIILYLFYWISTSEFEEGNRHE